MAYYFESAAPKSAQQHNGMGYYLANGSSGRKAYTPPPEDVYHQQDCPSCGSQWAAENAAGLVLGGFGLLASGIGIGYLLGSKNDEKPTPTLNSLKNNAALYRS